MLKRVLDGSNSVCTIYFPKYKEQYKAGVLVASNLDAIKRKDMVILVKMLDIKLLIPADKNEEWN